MCSEYTGEKLTAKLLIWYRNLRFIVQPSSIFCKKNLDVNFDQTIINFASVTYVRQIAFELYFDSDNPFTYYYAVAIFAWLTKYIGSFLLL